MYPRITVLDGYTLNPGDLSWHSIEALGSLTVYDRTVPEDVFSRAADADMVLTNKAILDGDIIESLPNLKYIGVLATGYNVVDLEAADNRGIPVTNVPEYSTNSVAEAVFALILELTRQVGRHNLTVRKGKWESNADFSYWDTPLAELHGLTIGIVGWGRIGQAVGRVARAFGMHCIVHTRSIPDTSIPGVSFVGLDDVFRQADIVTLHCPLTEETEGMVDTGRLTRMKSSSYLINTGRGPLVVDTDLADALNEGIIAGAGLDVLTVEPPRGGNPLIGANNCFITPHIAWAARASRERLMATVADNIRAFLQGAPINIVNHP